MDILSKRGQQSLADEQKARDIFLSNYPMYSYIQTQKDQPADIDALLVHNGVIAGVVETKCRYDVDHQDFIEKYENSWLVTFDKIARGKLIADAMCTKLIGFLYIVQSETLLVQTISDCGLYVPDINIITTQTQATINGRTAVRSNAYIDMSKARHLVMKTPVDKHLQTPRAARQFN
jgi:hypothetical protein